MKIKKTLENMGRSPRHKALIGEMERTADKLRERLQHDNMHRSYPMTYAIRFICSPWEEEEETNIGTGDDAIPTTDTPSSLHEQLEMFLEASSFSCAKLANPSTNVPASELEQMDEIPGHVDEHDAEGHRQEVLLHTN